VAGATSKSGWKDHHAPKVGAVNKGGIKNDSKAYWNAQN